MQGRPALVPGDAVCLRSDEEAGVEYVAALLAADSDTLLLAAPPAFWCRPSPSLLPQPAPLSPPAASLPAPAESRGALHGGFKPSAAEAAGNVLRAQCGYARRRPQRHAAERFHVRFSFDRTYFTRMHRALATAPDELLALLPPPNPSGLVPPLVTFWTSCGRTGCWLP